MRWFKPNLRSIYGLLGNSPAAVYPDLEDGMEEVRESMLSALGAGGPRQFPQIARRIKYANDIHALWYLRGDLMAALSAMHGEAAARKRIFGITQQFQGLVPGGMASRPSPLN
jgi:hypothetical protein